MLSEAETGSAGKNPPFHEGGYCVLASPTTGKSDTKTPPYAALASGANRESERAPTHWKRP